ncbi:MAG: SAM-dependent methyltransferase [Roseovarius sp.]
MTSPLTDREALCRQRVRAARAPIGFLHQAARDEIEDRLSLVNKSFQDAVVITGHPMHWQGMHPSERIVPDEDTLALTPGAQDLAIHAMALHWANDPVGQLIQCRRALRPDGFFLGICLGGETLHELRTALAQAESDLYGGLSPRVAPMAEIRDLGALLQRAGFALPVADSLRLTASYESPLHLMRELRFMGEANALARRSRKTMKRGLLEAASRLYAQHFSLPDGRVRATFELIILTGWAPDESQPKPLRPGSARARLADALGTAETPLKD